MAKEIVINVSAHERRMAVVENGKLEEFLIERPDQERLIYNIYVGIVEKVQPSMQAAFVDIGLGKAAFLSGADLEADHILSDPARDPSAYHHRRYGIEGLLHKGQRLLVQIIKEPIGTKGAKISMELSFPGRFVVLLSGTDFVGVSKRTHDAHDRRDLKRLIASVKPPEMGVIVRTIGLDAEENDFRNEIEMLYDKYKKVRKAEERSGGPALIYKEMGLAASVMRDLFTRDVTRVVVDSKPDYKEILSYLKAVDPEMRDRVFLYGEREPLFDYYGIEKEVDKILRRKVWLRNGGYLIFDRTEALVAVDVNTGRFSGKGRDHESTIFAMNREAVHEIARQIRLRDIGGLIIIDLIDMENPGHRHQIYEEFCKAMARDKAAHNIGRISEFGLIELTRKRVRPEVMQLMSEVCPTCGGTGSIFSATTVLAQINRCLHRNRVLEGEKKLQLEVSNALAVHLSEDRSRALKGLMKDNRAKLELFVNDEFNTDEFRIYEKNSGEDITERLIGGLTSA